jgi:WD40 repeat protein
MWDAATGKPLGVPLTHQAEVPSRGVTSAAFRPDGTRMVTASYDKTARVWDAATGKPLGAPLTHQAQVTRSGSSRDGCRSAE